VICSISVSSVAGVVEAVDATAVLDVDVEVEVVLEGMFYIKQIKEI
jgi:hypothetical protein